MRIIILFVCLIFLAGCVTHNLLRKTPVMDVNLADREVFHWEDLTTGHLLPEGLMVEMSRPPHDLKALYNEGIEQADGGFTTGLLLATLVCRYKVTGDPVVLEQAKVTCDALHMLLAGSGYRGLVARSFGKHNVHDPDYVFNKVSSGDQLVGWMLGNSFYCKYIKDPERHERIAKDLLDICWHLKHHDLRLYVDENTPIPIQYGGFRTPFMGVPVGNYAMPMMALANFAVRMSPGNEQAAEFLGWLEGKSYPRQTQYFYSWFPHRSFNVNIYILASTIAFDWDEDETRREFYIKGREAFWDRCYDWQIAPFALLYRRMGGTRREGNYDDDVARLRNLTPRYSRSDNENGNVKSHTVIVPLEDRVMSGYIWSTDVFLEAPKPTEPFHPEKYARLDFLFAYWLGRLMDEYQPKKEK